MIYHQYRTKIDGLIPTAKKMTRRLLASDLVCRRRISREALEARYFHRCMNSLAATAGLRRVGPYLTPEQLAYGLEFQPGKES